MPPQSHVCCAVSTLSRSAVLQCLQRGADAALIAKREGKEAAREKVRLAQEEADAAYQAALVNERVEVALIEGPAIREDIQGKVPVQAISLFRQMLPEPSRHMQRIDIKCAGTHFRAPATQ